MVVMNIGGVEDMLNTLKEFLNIWIRWKPHIVYDHYFSVYRIRRLSLIGWEFFDIESPGRFYWWSQFGVFSKCTFIHDKKLACYFLKKVQSKGRITILDSKYCSEQETKGEEVSTGSTEASN
jgi:hypothetical protein